MRNKFTPEEDEYILNNYQYVSVPDMCKHLGRSESGVRKCLRRYGLIGAKRYYEFHKFKKGHVPANKGVKELTSEKNIATFFPKGHQPHNTRKVGQIWLSRSSQGYYEHKIKTESGIKSLKHYVWEQHNGKIPPKHVVRFINKRLDYSIENLECISMADNARRNANRAKYKAHFETGIAYTDKYCAGRSAYNNPELKQELLNNPELLETIKLNMKLRKQIICKKESLKS